MSELCPWCDAIARCGHPIHDSDEVQRLKAELAAAKVTAFTTCPNCGAGLDDGQCRECIESDAWLREQNATLKARVQRLTDAAHNYMSQFGQALDANDIPYTQAQESVDRELRAALAEGEDTRG